MNKEGQHKETPTNDSSHPCENIKGTVANNEGSTSSEGCQISQYCLKAIKLCTPSKSTVMHTAIQALSLLLIYGATWGLLGKNALPGSAVFALLLLVVSSYIGGRIAALIRLPPLIGMLIVGFMFRNLPFIHYYWDIPVEWSSALRRVALVVILLRAGFGINPDDLRRLKYICLRLALLPCLVEAIAASLIAYFLFGFPWPLCFCLGFVLSAISPAVVIPGMLELEKDGYGEDKGISTLVITAASIDDVCAITGFSVAIDIAFSKGNVAWTLAKGPLGVLIGLAYGVLMGVILWYTPNPTEKRKIYYRVILLSFAGLAITFISKSLTFASAGAIGCLVVAFTAALRWRKEEDKNVHVADVENGFWVVLQVFLFGLIGAEVSLNDIQDDVGYGVLTLFTGLFFRVLVIYFASFGAGLNFKEKIFVEFAWLPKATVQAAIGGLALDMAKEFNQDYIAYGEQIIARKVTSHWNNMESLTVAVLSILITAPIGAIAIAVLGPLLLKKRTERTNEDILEAGNEEELVY